jgi:hypothetical protein
VCLRNFGVLYLAGLQKYTFAFASILDELTSRGCLTHDQVRSLRQLRRMKMLYRNGARARIDGVMACLDDVARSLPSQVLSVQCRPVSSSEIISAAKSLPSSASAYHRLRNLEKVYVALLDLGHGIDAHPKLVALRRWIEDPRSYAGLAEAHESDIIDVASSCSVHKSSARQGTPVGSLAAKRLCAAT